MVVCAYNGGVRESKAQVSLRSSAAEYLTYVAAVGDGGESFEIRYEDENIWLTQKMLAGIYGVDIRTVNYHIKKVFEDAELQEDSVIRNFRITATRVPIKSSLGSFNPFLMRFSMDEEVSPTKMSNHGRFDNSATLRLDNLARSALTFQIVNRKS